MSPARTINLPTDREGYERSAKRRIELCLAHFANTFVCGLIFDNSFKNGVIKWAKQTLMRLSVASLAAVSDFLYLTRFVGKLVFYKRVLKTVLRKTSKF